MADGRWQMADGRWQMADGRWQMADEGARSGAVTWQPAFYPTPAVLTCPEEPKG